MLPQVQVLYSKADYTKVSNRTKQVTLRSQTIYSVWCDLRLLQSSPLFPGTRSAGAGVEDGGGAKEEEGEEGGLMVRCEVGDVVAVRSRGGALGARLLRNIA